MHQWHIRPEEYARQEERRGRRFAYASLVPERTALVVVDMVPFFITQNPYCRGIVPNIHVLAEAMRQSGGHVAWVLPASAAPSRWAVEFYGEKVAEMFAASGGTGAAHTRLAPYFLPEHHDMVVEKTAASAFFPNACPLRDLLKKKDINTVLVAGTVTNVCCESTVRDAATLGYRVIMVADANAAKCDADHNATLHTVYRSFADVRPTAHVLAMLSSPAI